MSDQMSRPLFVIADAQLLEQLLALAATVDIEPELAPDAVGAGTAWLDASLVVLDASAAADCARLQLPRRGGVVLLSEAGSRAEPAEVTDRIWQLAAQLDADHVVQLPAATAWLADRLKAAHGSGGAMIGVIGGRGGSGASVLSCALAVTAAGHGRRTLLMDADPLGGGLDVLLGRERFEEARWPEIVRRADSNSGDIYDVLPRLGELSLLSWDRGEQRGVPPDVVRRVIDVAKRGSDVVIVDLPRAPDDAAKVALGASDALVVVVPAEVRSVAAAARVIAGVRSYCDRVHVVVCTPSPVGLKPSEIATALHLPLLGTMAFEPALALAIEKGAAFSGRRRTFLHELSELILHRLTGRAGGNV